MKSFLLCLTVVIALYPTLSWACAGCRNPNMPVTRMESMQLRKNEFRVGAVLGGTTLHIVHKAGCEEISDCDLVPVQPLYLHDQQIYPAELRILGEWGLNSTTGLEFQMPLRLVYASVDYTTPEGEAYEPLDPGVHHRNETLMGVGDPWLLIRWAVEWGGYSFSTKLGSALPLGQTEENPFELGDRGEEHQHIQFGTGTFDPVFSADVSKPLKSVVLTGYFQGKVSLYENSHGFRAGPNLSGGLQAGKRLMGSLTGNFGVEGLYEGPEEWDGSIKQDGNLGRTEVLLSLLLIQKFKSTVIGFSARSAVFRHIEAGDEDPGTLSSPVMVSLILSRKFKL